MAGIMRAVVGLAGLTLALVVAAPALGPGTSASAASCEVGEPSVHEPSADDVVGEVLVIGCGHALAGPVEIAAYRTEEDWLCVQVHHPDIEVSPVASCPHGRPQDGEAIEFRSGGLLHPGDVTDAVADLRYGVRKVKARFIGEGGSRSGDTVLARVNSGLAAKLGEPAAFGYVISFARGCAFDDVRMKAFDRRGKVLGTASGGAPGCPE